MNFLHPAIAAAGIASVALPIVIHLLFRRRRTPVEWAAMELLREAVKRTNRKLKFEQWIVLALRCLALLAAGLAIAVPMLDPTAIGGHVRRTTIVVVDNGPTSALRTGSERELARIVDEVRATLADRETTDRVGVITAAMPPALVLAPTADAGSIEQALARIEPSETPADLKGALSLATQALGAESGGGGQGGGLAAASDATRVLVASAFRRGSLPDGTTLADAKSGEDKSSQPTELIALVPSKDGPSDVRVARVEARPAPAGEAIVVRVTLEREGSSLESARTSVRATGAGLAAAPSRTVNWESGQAESTVDFQLLPGGAAAPNARRIGIEVSIDDDALALGNSAYAAVDVHRDLEVGVIGRRSSIDASDIDHVPASLWIARALSPAVGSGMRVREIDPSSCDERALLGLDAIVLARPDLVSPSSCDALGKFALAGGVVVVLPAGESLSQSWGSSVFSKLGVPMRIEAEAVEKPTPMRLADEQPQSTLLASIRPEIASLTAPIESKRLAGFTGFAKSDVILANADGTPYMLAQSPRRADAAATDANERGIVIALAAAPELLWTNLPVKPLMVPLCQEAVRAGVQLAAGRNEITVGERLRGEPSTAMRNERAGTLTIGADGASNEIVSKSGIWKSDAGAVVAANLRQSSLSLTPSSMDSVRAAMQPLGEVRFKSVGAGDAKNEVVRSGADWSFFLLLAALVVLLVEGVLSRIFSHASVRRAAGSGGVIATVGRVQSRSLSRARESQREEQLASGGGS